MAQPSETGHAIGINQEPLTPEFLKTAIKDRIAKLVRLASPTKEQRQEGFQVTQGFDQVPGIESGSMGFYYSGDKPKGEMLEFWRYYGIPDENDEKKFKEGTGRDACQRISLDWVKDGIERANGRKQSNIDYAEWDENKENGKIKSPYENSREALEYVDALIGKFETVVAHMDTTEVA